MRTRKRKDRIESCDLIPLATELDVKLNEYKLQVGRKHPYVFSGIQLETGLHMRWLKRLCVEAKITPFGVHGIRAPAEHLRKLMALALWMLKNCSDTNLLIKQTNTYASNTERMQL